MNRIVLRPLAKVNLGLDVVGKREDGYHEVRMVMQTLNLHDHMVMEKTDDGLVTMKTNLPYLPVNEKNLVVQAIQLIREEFHIEEGVRVNLKKVIPIAGGMAGGSSDAAAALFGMNLLFQLHLKQKELMERGLKLGADVPYCVMRGTALAEGIGEKLTPISNKLKCGVLVVKPSFSVSTKKVYEEFDEIKDINHPDIDRIIEAIRENDLQKMCHYMGNNLELVTQRQHPMIGQIKEEMMAEGALQSMMSGSGPTVFGIFNTVQEAETAGEVFRHRRGIGQVYVSSFYHVKGR